MSSIKTAPMVDNVTEVTGDHWKNWPLDNGLDPEYEVRSPVELSVTGNIPAYAAGTLYRTGTGKSQVETDDGGLFQVSHWFDGFSQTHRFQIMAGGVNSPTRVLYNSRFGTDAMIEAVRKTGTMATLGFGQKTDPCKAISNLQTTRHQSIAEPTERWTSVKGIQTVYLKTDNNIFQKVDPETLEPISLASQRDFHPDLNGPVTAAHARSDPVTGDHFNFNLSLGPTSTYRIFRVSARTGKTAILATFPGTPAFIHSFLITEDYVVLCVWNAHLNITKMDGSFKDSINPIDVSKPATWYVVDRKHDQGLVALYETDAFFSFHTINAWQEPSADGSSGTDIVADVIRADDPDFINSLLYENSKSSLPSAKKFAQNRSDSMRTTISRFRLPAVPRKPNSEALKGTLEWSACKALAPELPAMNQTLVTKKHRYVYAATFRGESTLSDGILKYDCETKEVAVWTYHGQSPSEPIFVPNPDGVQEDDGVLLSVVLDGMKEHSYLLCLDAQTMTELGRANVAGAVGFGFHGQHVPDIGMRLVTTS